MAKAPEIDDDTKRIMGALVRMPPKHHDEMKLSKAGQRKKKTKPSSNQGRNKQRPG
jgi:hypothetical protein